jgi:hypothetical protein
MELAAARKGIVRLQAGVAALQRSLLVLTYPPGKALAAGDLKGVRLGQDWRGFRLTQTASPD